MKFRSRIFIGFFTFSLIPNMIILLFLLILYQRDVERAAIEGPAAGIEEPMTVIYDSTSGQALRSDFPYPLENVLKRYLSAPRNSEKESFHTRGGVNYYRFDCTGYPVNRCSVVKVDSISLVHRLGLSYIFLTLTGINLLIVLATSTFLSRMIVAPISRIMNWIHSGTDQRLGHTFNICEVDLLVSKLEDAIDNDRMMRESQRLASIGQSTAMVAHDVRRPLSAMKALLAALPSIKDDPVQVERMITGVDRSISQTNAMLGDILEFSRDSTSLALAEHEPQGLVTSALGDALRNHPGARVRIEYSLKHRRTIRADSARIVRVLTNIIDNALDAMTPAPPAEGDINPAGGSVPRAYGDRVARGSLHMSTRDVERDGKGAIAISVSDSGPGIPADMLPRVFDPFFTHGKKGGTGLGLAISHRIISLHGGAIVVGNKEGRGAEFIIELPAGNGAAVINDAELILDSAELKTFREEERLRTDYGDTANTAEFMRINKERGRRSRLIMVDDEPLFRASVRNLLAQIGSVADHVEMIEADSAEEGLKLLAEGQFDYVIADIDLGKLRMNGYEFAGIVLDRYSNAHVLIHSNKRKDELDRDIRQIASARFMGFLPKPMKASELLQFLACKTFEAAKPRQPEEKKGRKVLLVNDDDVVRVGLRFQLKASGAAQVIEASGVSDALTKLAANHVDVILSDINLGDGEPSGYDLLKRAKEEHPAASFYFLSGYSHATESPKARQHGADGYLQLPAEEAMIREIVGSS